MDAAPDSSDNKAAEGKAFDFLFKIVIGGTDNVGKTSLLNRYVHGKYQDDHVATVGVDYMVKQLETKKGEHVKLEAWDLAGQQRFPSLTQSYYGDARGMLLVYDVTNKESFEHIDPLLHEVQGMSAENIVLFLIGNKADHSDSKREVTFDEGKQFADENGLSFYETSARDYVNVDEVFEQFVEAVVEAYKKERAEAAASGPRQISRPKLKGADTKERSRTCVIL